MVGRRFEILLAYGKTQILGVELRMTDRSGWVAAVTFLFRSPTGSDRAG